MVAEEDTCITEEDGAVADEDSVREDDDVPAREVPDEVAADDDGNDTDDDDEPRPLLAEAEDELPAARLDDTEALEPETPPALDEDTW